MSVQWVVGLDPNEVRVDDAANHALFALGFQRADIEACEDEVAEVGADQETFGIHINACDGYELFAEDGV